MRRFILAVAMLLTLWLVAGLLPAEGGEYNGVPIELDVGVSWVSLACEAVIETHEVVFLGKHDGYWYYEGPRCLTMDRRIWRVPSISN